MTPDRAAVTKWLLDLLNADANAYPVGDHGAPRGDITYPYWTVWGIPGGAVGGPALGASQADATYVYQIDSIGQTREQAEALGSRARGRVSGRGGTGAYVVPRANPVGMVVLDRVTDETPGAAISEGEHPNEVWTFSERIAISVSAQT